MPTIYPDWYIQPKQQINRIRELLYSNGEIWNLEGYEMPPVPENFQPTTAHEFLMIMVYLPPMDRLPGSIRTPQKLFELIEPPEGYDKLVEMEFNPAVMRMADGIEYEQGIRWVGYDPVANIGQSVRSLWEEPRKPRRLAGPEVFMASAIFPGYIRSWNGTSLPSPNVGGYKVKFGINPNARAPYLFRDDNKGQLKLSVAKVEDKGVEWGTPTVRVL